MAATVTGVEGSQLFYGFTLKLLVNVVNIL